MNNKGFKGFNVDENKNLNCRGHVFEIGKVYEIKGPVELCKNGFHFCWGLNNVHAYYNLRD